MNSTIVTLVVLICTIALIITKRVPLVAVGLFIISALTITKVIPSSESFIHLADKSILLFAGSFIIGAALFKVGFTDLLGERALKSSQKSEHESVRLLIICLATALLSSVLSSLGVQVAMMSLILAMADSLKISRNRAMVALGFSAGIGGMMTIIGTPLNMVGKTTYESLVPGGTIGIFEISRLTVPMGLVMMIAFCLAASRLIPDAEAPIPRKTETSEAKRVYTKKELIYVVVVFLAFIILVALDGKTPIPVNIVSVLVAFAIGMGGIMTIQEMLNAIDWKMLIFIAGITTLADAVKGSGLGEYLSSGILTLINGSRNEFIIISAVFLVCAAITQVISNAAAFGIVIPFIPALAESLGVDLKSLIMCAMVACSCGFILPLSAPSYPMLSEAGGVRTSDWLRAGIPMLVIGWLACVIFIPILWPLY